MRAYEELRKLITHQMAVAVRVQLAVRHVLEVLLDQTLLTMADGVRRDQKLPRRGACEEIEQLDQWVDLTVVLDELGTGADAGKGALLALWKAFVV